MNYLEIFFQSPVRWEFHFSRLEYSFALWAGNNNQPSAYYNAITNCLYIPNHKMNINLHKRLYEYFQGIGMELKFIDYGSGERGYEKFMDMGAGDSIAI